MAEKEFIGSRQSILKKFPGDKNTAKEKKQTILTLLLLFGFVLISILIAISYREIPKLKDKFYKPAVVVSKKFPEREPSPTPTPKFEKEKEAVSQMLLPLRGEYGIYFEDIESGGSFSINGKNKFQSASLNKLPVMLTLYREAGAGRMKLDTVYKLQVTDKRNGAGSLQYKPAGFEISFRQMAELMGKQSDNTAFNILSNLLGNEKIQAVIKQLGMSSTSFADWESTPEDIGLFFRKLYKEKIVTGKDKEEILSFLTDTIWEDRIPAGLPKEIKVAHKIGTEIGVISDAGIIFSTKPYILVIMSQDVNEIEAKKVLPEISKKIYELLIGRKEN